MIEKQEKKQTSKKKQQLQKRKEQTFKNADDFLIEMQLKMQPISLASLHGQSTISPGIFPHAIQFDDNMEYFAHRVPEYQLEVEVAKDIRQSKKERMQYQKERSPQQPKAGSEPKVMEKLKMLEDKEKSNYEIRLLTLTSNNLKPVKYLRNITLQEYKCFVIQQNSEWRKTKARMSEIINQIKSIKPVKKLGLLQSFLMKFGKQEDGQPTEDMEYNRKIEEIVNSSFLFIQNWHYNQTFPVRLICVHKTPEIEEGHFYVYMREYPTQIQNPNEPFTLSTAYSLRNKLILAYAAQKHKDRAQKISQAYLENTKTNIGNHMVLKNLEEKFVQPPKQVKLTQSQRLNNDYTRWNVTNFMQKWREKSIQQHENSKLFLYVQPICILIPKTHFARNISLVTDTWPSLQFDYSSQNDNSFVFTSKSQQTLAYPLESLKNLEFEFVAKILHQSGRLDSFRNKINLALVENEALGFSYRLALVPDDLSVLNNAFRGDFPYVLMLETAIKRAAPFQTPTNLKLFREVNLVVKTGKIPNMYSSFYQYDYQPSVHPLVAEILSGAPTQINERNFLQTYLQFANFFQSEENKSQNYCEYLRINKIKAIDASGFVMRERYSKYSQYMSENLQKVKKGYPEIFSGVANINKHTIRREIANLTQDMKGFESVKPSKIHHLLQRYIIYHCLRHRDGRKIGSHVSMVNIASRVIEIYERRQQSSPNFTNSDLSQLSIFFIAFMEALYPYSNFTSLQQDLIHMRVLTQKYLPQFNYLLNRKGVGLENYASAHLLELFSSLPMELCYRIWDFMTINIPKMQHVRLVCLLTVMLYQQKSDLLPIFPINQIIESMQINSIKYKLDDSAYYSMSKVADTYGSPAFLRQQKIVDLAKHKYLRKFIFGTAEANVAQDEEDFPRASEQAVQAQPNQRVHTKLISLKELKYPLPRPFYEGQEISRIYLFVSGVFLLNNLNLHSKTYELQVNLVGGSEIVEISINDKSAFQNKFIEFNFSKESRGLHSKPIIEFRLIQKKNPKKMLMSSRLRLSSYHKDVIYRENVILHKAATSEQYELNNLGTSVVTLSLVLRKSDATSNELDRVQEETEKVVEYFQKYLDFDLSPNNNEGVKAMSKLDKRFKKIMDPIDQLDVEKYQGLRISAGFGPKNSDWIKNSQVTIEELKAIFSFIFSDQSEKNIRLDFPKFYENYASNFQKFDLGKFLMQLILMSEVPKSKKLSMLFCLGVHYQGVHHSSDSQEMTVETFNSMVREMHRSTGFLNACPYTHKYFGQIEYGCFYEKGNKVQQNKREITEILQDWAYVCALKSQYGGLILGSVEDLSVLRALLPTNIVKQIEQQQLCRFQIHYKINEEIYVWSATVKTSDFSIERRGVKFLNAYPKYYQRNSLMTSVEEAMYNSENMIPLQSKSTIDYQDFVKIFKQSPLLDYLLRFNQRILPSAEGDKTHYFLYQIQKYREAQNLQRLEGKAAARAAENQFYTDFGIFRSQNCMPRWRSCKVIEDQGRARAVVEFKNKPGLYLVPRFEIICLDEVELANKASGDAEISESQFSR